MAYDLLIKNGMVVDGSGKPRFHADLAVQGGKIAAIGKIDGAARNTIDAAGQIVCPGFIDPHTHYDAQICWDSLTTPSPLASTRPILPACCLPAAPAPR